MDELPSDLAVSDVAAALIAFVAAIARQPNVNPRLLDDELQTLVHGVEYLGHDGGVRLIEAMQYAIRATIK